MGGEAPDATSSEPARVAATVQAEEPPQITAIPDGEAGLQPYFFSIVVPRAKLGVHGAPLGVVLPPHPPHRGSAVVIGVSADYPNIAGQHELAQGPMRRSQGATVVRDYVIIAQAALLPRHLATAGGFMACGTHLRYSEITK